MKKPILFLASCMLVVLCYGQTDYTNSGSSNIVINDTNFPDANFRSYLLSQSYGSDGILTQHEINGVTSLNVSRRKIGTLKGIEHFTALTYLDCSENQLTTLDMSKNTALTQLDCFTNQLTTLDLSKNTALTFLCCDKNQLTTLDVSKNTALTQLWCSYNQLTTLDVSKNTALIVFSCGGNQLTTLDVSKNTALSDLTCRKNQLTMLDVSKNTALTGFSCSGNQLTTLDVSKNTALIDLTCSENQLTTLDVSKNTALTILHCSENQLTTLDVSNTALTSLICSKNNINGVNMDNLIAGLRQNNTNSLCYFEVIDTSGSHEEGNVCTKTQVAAIKAKGWTPYYCDGSKYDEYEGSDEEVVESLESISLPESIQLSVGETQTLTPVFTPASAAMGVTWSSEDESIATVDELEGIVTAVSPGTTTIYVLADDAEHMASCEVTVTGDANDDDTFAAQTVEGVTMTFKVISAADKTCQVGTGDRMSTAIEKGTSGTVTIPDTVNGLTVTDIGSYAFYNCSGLTSINIPNSVTSIGDDAFSGCI